MFQLYEQTTKIYGATSMKSHGKTSRTCTEDKHILKIIAMKDQDRPAHFLTECLTNIVPLCL